MIHVTTLGSRGYMQDRRRVWLPDDKCERDLPIAGFVINSLRCKLGEVEESLDLLTAKRLSVGDVGSEL